MIHTKKSYKILNDCRGMYEEEIFKTILSSRGIDNPNHFLYPTEDDLLPLDSLYRIDEAYQRVMQAINNKERVAVLWDTDTDGVTSGTIITRYLKNFGLECDSFIDEGKKHGVQKNDIPRFKSYDLLIIVDSLDSKINEYKFISEFTDIIILDHHAIKEEIPYDDYAILVSSQRNYDNPQLSGAGVVWKFCKYIDYQEMTDYANQYLDLAACGLVADMMDMSVMENRYIVNAGLNNLKNLALKKIIGSFEFNSKAIAFSVAPLINASNRMFENDKVIKAFSSDDNKDVLAYMRVIKKCKEGQNDEVDRLMPSVTEQCEEQINNKMIVVFIDTPYGIGGLLGNKLLEKYQRPILVLKDCGSVYAGSMRAVGVDDFRKIVNDSGFAKCDGHELAAGITINKDNYENLLKYVEDNLSELKFNNEIEVDVQINIEDFTRLLADKIKLIDKITGTNFKPVKAYINGITEYNVGMMSDYKHLVLKPNDYTQIIKWNFIGDWNEIEDHSLIGDELEVVGSLGSGWIGRTFSLQVIADEIDEVI